MTRLAALLGLAAAGLIGIATELTFPADPASSLPAPSPAAFASPAKPQATAWDAETAGGAAAALTQRPLFRPGRKPPAGGHVAAATVEPHPERPRLSGVIIGPDGQQAIFANADGKSVVGVPGGKVDRFTIKAILPDHVTLGGPDGDIDVRPTFLKPTQ